MIALLLYLLSGGWATRSSSEPSGVITVNEEGERVPALPTPVIAPPPPPPPPVPAPKPTFPTSLTPAEADALLTADITTYGEPAAESELVGCLL